MKKILIVLIVCMFFLSMLPGIVGESEKPKYTFKERRYIENREIITLYTEKGIVRAPNSKGKPDVYVSITNPSNGDTVSDIVTITIKSNDNPTIKIDGSVVGSGLSYDWDTNGYSDGSHTIEASAKGHTDSIVVTVNNGGNTPPVVTITNPNDGDTVSGTVTIIVTATDAEDGNLIPDISIDDEYITTANSYDWDTTSYSDGSHTIHAETTDSGDLTGSDTIEVTVDNGVGNPVDKYALVIGISDYEGTANDLKYCDDDAIDWKNFLEDEGYTVTILIDSDATAEGINASIDDLLAAEDENDYVAFTYSGHGMKYGEYGSGIVSHDLYYMSHGWFEQKFDSSDSQHMYFTFDACVIGDFIGLIDSNKVGVFASDNMYSYEWKRMKNGVFTYYQIDGWDNQGYDNFEDDGYYAIDQFKAWAEWRNLQVDPFLEDAFIGPMMP